MQINLTKRFVFTTVLTGYLCSPFPLFADEKYTLDDEIAYLHAESLLDYTVVSSSKIEQKLTNAPSIISAFNETDIKRLGARTLSDVLQTVPGMQVQFKSNGRQKVWVRGVQSEFNQKILIYLDGVPFRDVFGDFAIDEELPLENIKRIEIIRGPGGTLYGANAYSGVINLYTYQPGEKNKQRVKVEYGNQNTQSGYFAMDQDIKIAKVLIDGKIMRSNGTTPEFDNTGKPNNRSREQGLNFVRLKSGFFNNELILTSYFGEYDYQRADIPYTADNKRLHRNVYVDLAYQHAFNNKLSIENKINYIWRNRIENENSFTNNSKQVLNLSNKFTDQVELFNSRNYLTYKATDTNTLVAGFEIEHNHISGTVVDNLTNKTSSLILDPYYQGLGVTNYGILMQDTQSFFDKKLTLTAGMRYDALQLFKNQFSYRLGLVYNFTPEIFTKLLYATAYRSPTTEEISRAPINSARPESELMKTIEGQIGYQSKSASYTLTAYCNKLNGVIMRNTQPNIAAKYLNADSEYVYGLELESKFFFNENFDGFLNGTVMNARDKNTEQAIPLLTDWTLSFGLNWHQKIAIGELHLDNNVMVYGKRTDWPISTWNQNQQQRYPNRKDNFSDGFAIWNLGVHYEIKESIAKGLKLGLLMRNVTDEINYSQNFTLPAANKPAAFDNQYNRRQIVFSIDYSF